MHFTDDMAILAEGVGVTYRLPVAQTESFKQWLLNRVRGRGQHRSFPALTDVSFSVRRGEHVGVIGSNGAGKSTLLRVISRILPPSGGRIRVRGRVAPLLGLGAGFNPELTGRENIYLNASLLGLPRERIRRLYDGIVDFSELGEFIESPIRVYSAGMMSRLAFSIASTVSPDVLILDEVLAVGDQAFQTKCERRLREFRTNGTTILLVSHSLASIRSTCTRVLWLEQGRPMQFGPVDEVLGEYVRFQQARTTGPATPMQATAAVTGH